MPFETSTSPLPQNSIILEIRAGAGGEEASLWAMELLKMYTRFANLLGFKVVDIDEGVIRITGLGAFAKFKYESGVHRVQRTPKTERQGRIHTSTASVAVLPEISEKEILINPGDLEWQFFRASSHGGQNVQKVSSAVRLKHLPTGLIATSQRERSQEQNREIALNVIRAKLWQREEDKRLEALGNLRSVIGRAMRAEKIRTYNFPQDRVTDHRIGKSWKNLESILSGNLGKITEVLKESLKE